MLAQLDNKLSSEYHLRSRLTDKKEEQMESENAPQIEIVESPAVAAIKAEIQHYTTVIAQLALDSVLLQRKRKASENALKALGCSVEPVVPIDERVTQVGSKVLVNLKGRKVVTGFIAGYSNGDVSVSIADGSIVIRKPSKVTIDEANQKWTQQAAALNIAAGTAPGL